MAKRPDCAGFLRDLGMNPRLLIFSSNPARRLWQALTARRRVTTSPTSNG